MGYEPRLLKLGSKYKKYYAIKFQKASFHFPISECESELRFTDFVSKQIDLPKLLPSDVHLLFFFFEFLSAFFCHLKICVVFTQHQICWEGGEIFYRDN
jgi:hypothetical protein